MRRTAGILVALGALIAAGAAAEPRPASGGVRLFRALEAAPLALAGSVSAIRALDETSYAATLVPEQVFRGAVAGGARLEIAWEELSRARPVRFAEGTRILVALERLPGASIWRGRIPDPARLARTLGIAERGDAFARNPSPGSLRLVEHFLALPPALRDGNPGVAHLAKLAEGARPVVAGAALARLGEVPDLDAALDPVSAGRLVTVLLRDPRELGDALLALLEERRPDAMRGPLLFRATPDGMGPARAYRALGAIDDGLGADRVGALLRRDDSAAHRAVGARYAGPDQGDALVRRLRSDPAPAVRAAAVTRLAELRGEDALDRLLFAFGDGDVSVRQAAVEAVANLGSAAVPGLRRVADHGIPEAARTAVAALRACGPEGIAALREIAAGHPDESVRVLARTALGGPIGHTH